MVTFRPTVAPGPRSRSGPGSGPLPEGPKVVSADESRPGPRHRGGVERVPHPERRSLVERPGGPFQTV